jgi:poly(3-hydroxybutyrate) depolymerase
VILHGCTQSPDDFAAGENDFIAEEQVCFVVDPAQRSHANQSKCGNWFRTTDQRRGEGEPSIIAGTTRQGHATIRLIKKCVSADRRQERPL